MTDIKLKEDIKVCELINMLMTLKQDATIGIAQRLFDNKHGLGEYFINPIDLISDQTHHGEGLEYVFVNDKTLLKSVVIPEYKEEESNDKR